MAKQLNGQLLTALWENGMLDKDIAVQMGKTEASIKAYRYRNGMENNKDIFDWVDKGLDEREIAIRECR